MKDNEQVEIFTDDEGNLVAVGAWGIHTFTHGLPDGFHLWTDEEQRAHLKRYVVPWLYTQIRKAKEATETAVGAIEPINEFREVSPKLLKALEKREKRALKLIK